MESTDDPISAWSDFQLAEKIEDYKKHISNLSTKDNNTKLQAYLQRLFQVQARRQRQPQLEKGGGNHEIHAVMSVQITEEANALKGKPDSHCGPLSSTVDAQAADNELVLVPHNELATPPISTAVLQYGSCNICHKPLQGADQSLCRQCKKKKKSRMLASFNPINTLKAKEDSLGRSLTETSDLRLSLTKRACVNLDDTLDAIVDISDEDEEEQTTMSWHLGSCFVKRQNLRSTSKLMRIQYPSRDDPEAIEIQYSDLDHLRPCEFLNDTIIDFYIKYLQKDKFATKEHLGCFHFFNSFFYKKLSMAKDEGSDEHFIKLHKWTRGVNIFEKTYLFIPVHDMAHWSLAVICFSRESKMVCLLHLDSIPAPLGHSSDEIFNVLFSYLAAEKNWLSQHDPRSEAQERVLSFGYFKRSVEVPLQNNEWDCGLFMLYYMERFVESAPVNFRPCDLDNMFGRKWFAPNQASKLRKALRNLLETLFASAKRTTI